MCARVKGSLHGACHAGAKAGCVEAGWSKDLVGNKESRAWGPDDKKGNRAGCRDLSEYRGLSLELGEGREGAGVLQPDLLHTSVTLSLASTLPGKTGPQQEYLVNQERRMIDLGLRQEPGVYGSVEVCVCS